MERYSLGSAADSGTHSRPAETPSDPNLPDLVGYRKARSLDPHAAGHHFTQSTFGGTTEDGNLRRFRARGTLDAPKPLAAVGRCFGQRNRDERLRITNRKSGIAPHSQKHAQLVSERLGIYLRPRAGLKQHGVGETPHQSRLPWFTSSLVGYRDGRLTFPRSKGTRQPPVPGHCRARRAWNRDETRCRAGSFGYWISNTYAVPLLDAIAYRVSFSAPVVGI